MNISAPFIHRPVATTLLIVAIALAGAVAFRILPVSPLPQVDFPDHLGERRPARRQPGDHGIFGGHAAGAPVRPHRRGHRDDLFEHPRLEQHHPAIRSEPQHRRRRARRAGGHHRRPRLPADQPAQQSHLPQGESGRFAHLHARAHLRRAEQGPDVRRRVHHHGAETVAGSGRGAGGRGRQRAARRARRAESRRAEQVRHRPGAGPHAFWPPPTPTRPRAISPTAARCGRWAPTTRSSRPSTTSRW